MKDVLTFLNKLRINIHAQIFRNSALNVGIHVTNPNIKCF